MAVQKLDNNLILLAYLDGAFPMGEPDGSIEFYQPRVRAVFPIDGFHLSSSLAKVIKKGLYEVRFDTCFEQVMRCCIRPPEEGNWINEEIIRQYTQMHREGWAHSCEIFLDGELVGGAYGICIGAAFMGEAMFHRKTNMSKVATYHLIERCRQLGFDFVDAQIPTTHLASLGAIEMPHLEYMKLLKIAVRKQTDWSPVWVK